ncbi:hypothetical protein BGP_1128 [Beggiatoa sp. PS]|nr:hypothetical protein BGP_1128 [Beggiatoa sp. PS]
MVRHQAQKDAELLRNERDTALDRLKQLEKENMRLLRQRGNNGYQKGVLIGGGVGILCLIVLIVLTFQTALFDSIVCELKNYPTECSFLPPLVTNHQDRTQ